MANETVVTGKKYRVLADASKKIWHVISFWTKASDVYNNNNQNLQTTVGGITGISSSLTSTASNVAASANAVKQLNDKITKLNSEIAQIKGITAIVGSNTTQANWAEMDLWLPTNGKKTLTIDSVKAPNGNTGLGYNLIVYGASGIITNSFVGYGTQKTQINSTAIPTNSKISVNVSGYNYVCIYVQRYTNVEQFFIVNNICLL